MPDTIQYRPATEQDITELANLCSQREGDEGYWSARIAGYMTLEFNPHQATGQRLTYVAVHDGKIIGFIAGHLTRRNDYPGQIQWIVIAAKSQRCGVGSKLLNILAAWFAEHDAQGVRTDIDPANSSAEQFYRHHHAKGINKYWLYWDDIRIISR